MPRIHAKSPPTALLATRITNATARMIRIIRSVVPTFLVMTVSGKVSCMDYTIMMQGLQKRVRLPGVATRTPVALLWLALFEKLKVQRVQESAVNMRSSPRCGGSPVQLNSLRHRVQIRAAVRARLEVLPDRPAPGGIQVLVEIFTNVEIHFLTLHSLPPACDAIAGVSSFRRNARARLNLDFTAS